MKKIAFIHDTFPIGGAERVTLDICNYLYKNSPDYRCYVFANSFDEESLSKRLVGKIELRQIPRKAERSKAVEKLIVEEGINLIILVVRPLPDTKGISERTGCNNHSAIWHIIPYEGQSKNIYYHTKEQQSVIVHHLANCPSQDVALGSFLALLRSLNTD